MSRTLRIDETGNRYGSLVVTGVVYRPLDSRIKRSKAKWFCKCDCGEMTAVFGDKLRNGHISRCLRCEKEIRNRPMDTLVKRLRKEQQWGNSLDGEAADRIEKMEAALNKILQKCPYSKRDKWCSNLDCNCVVARAALGETK